MLARGRDATPSISPDGGLADRSSRERAGTTQGTVWTLALLLVISLLGIGRPLWTPDEPREAEISREMLLSPGVVPTLGGSTFIEKPPLYYWTVAGAFALTGRTSPATARSVSAVSAFLTLLLVFLWGRREFSAAVGAVAAVGLATSARFLISTHWVIIDPLLMLLTTGALWAGWALIRERGRRAAAVFCGALALALWTKGLIGPVLVGAGLAVYCLVEYKRAPWRRLRIVTAFAVMLGATGILAWAIYATAGWAAVREWFWVNHVQRFFDPQDTGHDQPLYYYLWAIPVAMLPWWLAALESLKPGNWLGTGAGVAVKRYWGLVALGMAIVLSAAATKREIYLLPLLPPLFLVVAANVMAAWNEAAKNPARGIQWWAQVALSAAFATAPVIAVSVYLGTADAVVVAFLIAVAVIVTAIVAFAILGHTKQALGSLLACTVAGALGLLVIMPHQANDRKNMAPFLEWANKQLPAAEPVYALGRIDETLRGIVPFTTGRPLVPVTAEEVAASHPAYVLVQDSDGSDAGASLPQTYRLIGEQTYGTDRRFALWQASGTASNSTPVDAGDAGTELPIN